ncbi:DH domain-containing protein [Entamoeba marina]
MSKFPSTPLTPSNVPNPQRQTLRDRFSTISDEKVRARRMKLLYTLSSPAKASPLTTADLATLLHLKYLPPFMSIKLPLMSLINQEKRPLTEVENPEDFAKYVDNVNNSIFNTLISLRRSNPSPTETLLNLFTPAPPLLANYNRLSQEQQLRLQDVLHELLLRIYCKTNTQLANSCIQQLSSTIRQIRASYYARVSAITSVRKTEIQTMTDELERVKNKLLNINSIHIPNIPTQAQSTKRTEQITGCGAVQINGYSAIVELPANAQLHLVYFHKIPTDCSSFIRSHKNLKGCRVELNGRYKHLLLPEQLIDVDLLSNWVMNNPYPLDEKIIFLTNYFYQYVTFIKSAKRVRALYAGYFVRTQDRPTLKIPFTLMKSKTFMTVEFEFDAGRLQFYTATSDPFKPVKFKTNVISGIVTDDQIRKLIETVLKNEKENWLITAVERINNL